MDEKSDRKVTELKDRLDRGEYTVDPGAVADAILRRARDMAMLREHAQRHLMTLDDGAAEPHTACSYPDSSPSPVASVNTTRGSSPSRGRRARPIHVIGELAGNLASITLRAPGGAQTQSS
jgi:hypothetical protein